MASMVSEADSEISTNSSNPFSAAPSRALTRHQTTDLGSRGLIHIPASRNPTGWLDEELEDEDEDNVDVTETGEDSDVQKFLATIARKNKDKIWSSWQNLYVDTKRYILFLWSDLTSI